MAFNIPSLPDLVQRGRSAFRAYLSGTDAWLWPNNIGPAAKVNGGLVSEVFGFAAYIAKQIFASTADGDNLVLHGAEYGLSKRPSAPARGFVDVTLPGPATVSEGAVFLRGDDLEYRALVSASIATAGVLSIDSVATTTGKIGIAEAGAPLVILSGVSDPNATAVVGVAGIAGGLDVEADGDPFTTDLSTFRGRILFRKRNPPFGGAPADYVQWCTGIAGVTRVFVERVWNGSGTVRIFPLMDDLYPSGIPPVAEIARVADSLALVEPGDAIVTIAAPVAHPIDVAIAGLTPNTIAAQEAVKAELRATFRRKSAVAGTTPPHPSMPYLATPQSFARQWIWEAVANAAGEQRAKVTAPADDVALLPGEIATLGAVTFPPA